MTIATLVAMSNVTANARPGALAATGAAERRRWPSAFTWPDNPVVPTSMLVAMAHFIADDMRADDMGRLSLRLDSIYGAAPARTAPDASRRIAAQDGRVLMAPFAAAMLRFHDAVMAAMGPGATATAARRQTIWHYQWLVVNAFLPATCDPSMLAQAMADPRRTSELASRARRALVATGGGDADDRFGLRSSKVVAGTLLALIADDPRGYWNGGTVHGGRWSPIDGVRPGGIVPDSLNAFLHAGRRR